MYDSKKGPDLYPGINPISTDTFFRETKIHFQSIFTTPSDYHELASKQSSLFKVLKQVKLLIKQLKNDLFNNMFTYSKNLSQKKVNFSFV